MEKMRTRDHNGNMTVLLMQQLNFHFSQHLNDSKFPNSFMNEETTIVPDPAKVTITAVVVFGFPVIVLTIICLLRFRISRLRTHGGYIMDRKIESLSNSTYVPSALADQQSNTLLLKTPRAFRRLELRKKCIQSENLSDSDKTKDTFVEGTANSNYSSPGYDFLISDTVDIENLNSYVIGYEATEELIDDSQKVV